MTYSIVLQLIINTVTYCLVDRPTYRPVGSNSLYVHSFLLRNTRNQNLVERVQRSTSDVCSLQLILIIHDGAICYLRSQGRPVKLAGGISRHINISMGCGRKRRKRKKKDVVGNRRTKEDEEIKSNL